MSTKIASLTPPATLADVMERIVSLEGLQRQRRDDLLSALRQVAKLLGGLPADIGANPEALRRGLNALTPASAGMTKRRSANIRALLAAALDLAGAKVLRRKPTAGLTPSWLALRDRVGIGTRARACPDSSPTLRRRASNRIKSTTGRSPILRRS